MGFPGDTVVKNLPASSGDTGDAGSIPGSRRSPREGNGLQYSSLENSMDKGAWWTTVHGVAKNLTWLSDWEHYPCLWSQVWVYCENLGSRSSEWLLEIWFWVSQSISHQIGEKKWDSRILCHPQNHKCVWGEHRKQRQTQRKKNELNQWLLLGLQGR